MGYGTMLTIGLCITIAACITLLVASCHWHERMLAKMHEDKRAKYEAERFENAIW